MTLIETIAALALVYALLSVMASAMKEMIESWTQQRKKGLRCVIVDLLGSAGAQRFLEHELIDVVNNAVRGRAAGATGSSEVARHSHWPTYIETAAFARAAFDVLQSPQLSDEQRRALANSKLGRLLSRIEGDINVKLAVLEQAYELRMQRLVGSFKRHAQWWLFGIGVVLALGLDADTLRLARTLGADPTQRAVLVALAEKTTTVEAFNANCAALRPQGGNTEVQTLANCVQDNLSGVLGWTLHEWNRLCAGQPWMVALNVLLKLMGLAITALAVSMGAPFWFDVINKVANLRATLKPKPRTVAVPAAQTDITIAQL